MPGARRWSPRSRTGWAGVRFFAAFTCQHVLGVIDWIAGVLATQVALTHVQDTMVHKYNKWRRVSPDFSKGDHIWVRCQSANLGDKTCPYWDGPYEVVAKKAHNLYVIQVDQRRLVDVHVECLMKTVNSPRSPVPLNYTKEIARVPPKFEEDTYNVKKILGHRIHRKRLLFKVRWEGYTKDWDTKEPVDPFLPSYKKMWRGSLKTQNLTQIIDLLAHPWWTALMSVPQKTPSQYGDILLFGEGRREREAVGYRTRNVHARRAPRLQKSPPQQGGGYRRFTPPSTSLTAKGLRVLGVWWRGI